MTQVRIGHRRCVHLATEPKTKRFPCAIGYMHTHAHKHAQTHELSTYASMLTCTCRQERTHLEAHARRWFLPGSTTTQKGVISRALDQCNKLTVAQARKRSRMRIRGVGRRSYRGIDGVGRLDVNHTLVLYAQKRYHANP